MLGISLIVLLLTLSGVLAAGGTDSQKTMVKASQMLAALIDRQQDTGDWIINDLDDGDLIAGVVSTDERTLLAMACIEGDYTISLALGGSGSLGTHYEDFELQPVELNWTGPNLTQSQQWFHYTDEDSELDLVVITSAIEDPDVENFFTEVVAHTGLRAVITTRPGSTKSATFRISGAPVDEVRQACGEATGPPEGPAPSEDPEVSPFFPYLPLGGGYEAVVIVSNTSNTPWTGAMVLLKGFADPWDWDWKVNGVGQSDNAKEIRLGGRETRKYRFTGGSEIRTGYLGLYGDSFLDIAVQMFYEFRSGGGLLDSVGVPKGVNKTDAIFNVEKSTTVNTGLAMSPGYRANKDFIFTATLFDDSGDEVDRKRFRLEEHASFFFDEVFDDVGGDFLGHVQLESDSDWFQVVVLRLELTGKAFQLTSVPVD